MKSGGGSSKALTLGKYKGGKSNGKNARTNRQESISGGVAHGISTQIFKAARGKRKEWQGENIRKKKKIRNTNAMTERVSRMSGKEGGILNRSKGNDRKRSWKKSSVGNNCAGGETAYKSNTMQKRAAGEKYGDSREDPTT